MKLPLAGALSLAVAALVPAHPAAAEASASSASSTASSATSASIGSLSNSIQASSASSTPGNQVTAGDYRVIELTAVEGRPDQLRLRLQALAVSGAQGEFFLFVPRTTVEQHRVETGQVIGARARPYGFEFAAGTPRQAFFLVVDDAWQRELRTTPVTL